MKFGKRLLWAARHSFPSSCAAFANHLINYKRLKKIIKSLSRRAQNARSKTNYSFSTISENTIPPDLSGLYELSEVAACDCAALNPYVASNTHLNQDILINVEPDTKPVDPMHFLTSIDESEYTRTAQRFTEEVHNEMQSINQFYNLVVQQLKRDLAQLKAQNQSDELNVRLCKPSDPIEQIELQDMCITMNALRTFVILNYLGVIKACKKHDKNSLIATAEHLIPSLYQQSFYQSTELTEVYSDISNLSRQGRNVDSDEELKCSICLQMLDCPILLSCRHR